MLQFITVLIYNVFGYFYFGSVCGKSQTPALAGSLVSAAIFLLLFRSFYIQAYKPGQSQPLQGGESKKVH